MSFVQFLQEMDKLESAGNGTKMYLQVKTIDGGDTRLHTIMYGFSVN